MNASSFPALLEGFFTERLLNQMGASPHTIATYRDTFRLFLRFALERLGTAPSKLRMEDLDVKFVSKFLDHLETSVATLRGLAITAWPLCTPSSSLWPFMSQP